MSEAGRLYGTDVPPVTSERIAVGDVSFSLEEGALRHICLGQREIIRGIAFLVRDRDWGTLQPDLSVVSRDTKADGVSLHLQAMYASAEARLDVSLFLEVAPDRLIFRAHAVSFGAFETNRTGFTVLHPAALAGYPVSVLHSGGTTEDTIFPTLIDPWQPLMDIKAITHHADGLAVRCAFEGDIFEMEDQRQWGDASFKTYNRPLALPWPYVLQDREVMQQSVTITWCKSGATATDPATTDTPAGAVFPQTAILLTAQDALRLAATPEDLAEVSPQRLLCHVDTSAGDSEAQITAFARLQATLPDLFYDLELVCGFAKPPAIELAYVRKTMDAARFRPDSVMVCPAVDRQSTPPGSDWPPCPPLEDIHHASAEVFAGIKRGGGMVSFFPELNRKRPPIDLLDFVSHALCPIVHAADDLSVMETLEAIPHITRTARSFIGEHEYRIGPSTLAMRHNPYGQRTIPNPDRHRMCMTHDDPRHRAAFGAAYTLGLACALAQAGVTVWTPSELYGVRGLAGPVGDAVSLLAGCSGETVHEAHISNGLAELCVGQRRIIANLTKQPSKDLGPYEYRVVG